MANIPNIRFKGFNGDWEQRKLGDVIADLYNGQTPSRFKEEYWNGDISWLSSGELNRGHVNHSIENITKAGQESAHLRLIPRGTFVMAITGLEAPGTRGNCAILDFETTLNQSCMALFPKKDMLTSEFLFQWYRKVGEDYGIRFTQGTKQQSYNAEIIKDLDICLPKVDEQKKISDYLDYIDNLITLHQRKCEEIKELKKYMLQKMFPKNGEKNPEIRFEGFTDDWEQRKLKDFGKATGGTSIESEFSEDGKYKVISIGSYSEDSVYRDQGIRAIESEKTKNRVLNEGDLTMILNDKTASGNIIGRALLIEKSGVYVYNQRTERIEVDREKFDSLFIYEMLNAPNVRDKIIKQSQGNTQIYVNWPTIAETNYLVPQIEEQRCLGEFFYNLDNLITLQQRKCDELKEVKKYMLQNMFPKQV